MTKGRRLLAWLMLLAALLLAVLGQRYFFFRRDYIWDGVFLHAIAIACFAIAWRLAHRPPRAARPHRALPRIWALDRPAVTALLAAGLALTILATLSARGRTLQEATGDAVALWMLGLAAVLAAAFWPGGQTRTGRVAGQGLAEASPREEAPGTPQATSGPKASEGAAGDTPPCEQATQRAPVESSRGQAAEAILLRQDGKPGHASTEPGGAEQPRSDSDGEVQWTEPVAQRTPLRGWLRRIRARRRSVAPGIWLELITVAGLALLALLLRATALDHVPFTLGGDEAWHGLLARQVLRGEIRNPFQMGYMSMPTLFYWPLSWSLWLVGDNMIGLRLLASLAGTAMVVVLYLLVRGRWGPRTALLAALFLATYDYHLHYSRLGANNIWDPLFVGLTLWAVDRGLAGPAADQEVGERSRPFLLAGLAMGLSTYFYTGARLLPPLVVVYIASVALRERGGLPHLGRHVVLLVLAFVVAAGPMLDYAVSHPDEWNARINQVGILQSGWLEREPELTGETTGRILAEQFLRAAGAFHVFADRTAWYGADRPLLGFLAGIFAILGMAWAVAHWRERRYFLLLLWFWSVIIAGGALTESPPSSQRLVSTIPVVAVLVIVGLEQAVALGRRILRLDRKCENALLGVLVLILAASSMHFYFVEFTPARRYGSEHGETATMMGRYLRSLDGDYTAYLLGAPRLYWSFGTMVFLAPDVRGQDVTEPLSGPPDFVDGSRAAVFLLLPERADELTWIEQAFPGGKALEFHDTRGRLCFLAYEAKPPGSQRR